MADINFLDMKKFEETVKGKFRIRVGFFPSSVFGDKIQIQFIFAENNIVAFELSCRDETIGIFHANIGYPTERELLEAYDALISFIEESPAFRLRSVTGEKIYDLGYSRPLNVALKYRKDERNE